MMLNIEEQLNSGKLVCPITHQTLIIHQENLQTPDHRFVYPLINGVPILLSEEKQKKYLMQQDGSMEEKYTSVSKAASLNKLVNKLTRLGGDYRTPESRKAFQEVIEIQKPNALCISIGGGPVRVHPRLVNLNIGLFPNVDVVGDAYSLPYADDSVNAIYCEAVLEHLEYPDRAVSEMFRALQTDGQVYAVTPFLQPFHAYPNHYQNFTLVGHQKLFEHAGFKIISSGVCVGPTFTFSDLIINYTRIIIPNRVLNQFMVMAVSVLMSLIRPLDLIVNRSSVAHVLASTTYIQAVKRT